MEIKGNNTHRHEQNPDEKRIHDEFLKCNYQMEQIVLNCNGGNHPPRYLSEEEKEIITSAIQWVMSPVGQGLLSKCGFEKVKD
jgi:hypothetical protein